jgi:hypothetical protein
MLLVFSVAAVFFFHATVAAAPKTFDTYLYAFDCSFGSPGSFLFGRLFASWPVVKWLSSAAYYLLPIVMAAFCGLQLANPKLSPSNIMTQFTVAAAIGWILYMVYPAVGPAYAFPRVYPASPPLLSAIRIDFIPAFSDAPRNCMPSLHAAWALLIVSNSRPFAFWVKLLANTFLLLTLLATLGLGEHYLIDLVVAFPFALGVRAFCAARLPRSQRERLRSATVGGVLTAAWILALKRKGLVVEIPALVSWALVVLTVGVCVYLEQRLSVQLDCKSTLRNASISPSSLPGSHQRFKLIGAPLNAAAIGNAGRTGPEAIGAIQSCERSSDAAAVGHESGGTPPGFSSSD